ncbi:hypothetical protein BCR34DRAFT_630779 [Clohesyomyces aquaticus]|uniref:Uncharacterized protein n=1 Tax=Clohesyomyces aquaticus TaxID=1231657 RepID=A0A1Y1ZE02_9PLEO|nr:hypothetical protein BCR34DRAFT_630779 [Clohesyomyces aquaticus]
MPRKGKHRAVHVLHGGCMEALQSMQELDHYQHCPTIRIWISGPVRPATRQIPIQPHDVDLNARPFVCYVHQRGQETLRSMPWYLALLPYAKASSNSATTSDRTQLPIIQSLLTPQPQNPSSVGSENRPRQQHMEVDNSRTVFVMGFKTKLEQNSVLKRSLPKPILIRSRGQEREGPVVFIGRNWLNKSMGAIDPELPRWANTAHRDVKVVSPAAPNDEETIAAVRLNCTGDMRMGLRRAIEIIHFGASICMVQTLLRLKLSERGAETDGKPLHCILAPALVIYWYERMLGLYKKN